MGRIRKLTEEEKRLSQLARVQNRRKNTAYRRKEQAKDTISHQKARQDPERRSQERVLDAAAHRKARENPERMSQERLQNTAAHRKARENPERRSQERLQDTAAHRKARENPERMSQERLKNTAAHRKARENPERRSQERLQDTAAHRKARENPERRSQERLQNTAAHRNARENPERRSQERLQNTAAHRKARENPERRSQERLQNTAAHREVRENPVVRRSERIMDRQRRAAARQNEVVRLPERVRDKQSRAQARKTPSKRRHDSEIDVASKRRATLQRALLQNQIAVFKIKEREYPEYICSCCGGLFFITSTKVVTSELLEQRGLTQEEISQLLYVNQTIHRLCDTCFRTANKQKSKRTTFGGLLGQSNSPRVHKLCLANGLDFPNVPDFIKNLSPLEERLVSPFLPFMQIRLLRPEQQSKLKGNVINVENDFDVCATVLPRNMSETSTVQVQLLRKLQYRNPVWHEIIRPYNVQKAMEHLIASEGYQERQIILSDDWNNHQPGDTVEFRSEPEEQEETRQANDNSDSEGDDDEIMARVNATETLIMDLESETMGYRIAPGEGKRPVPFLQDLDVEEITFPSIFGGQKRKIKEGIRLTNTDLFKSKIRNRNRICVRNSTYLLYLFKKSFNQKVRDAIKVCMRKQRPGAKITAGNLRIPGFLEQMIQMDNGYVVFQGVRSTPAYWKKQQKKVISMIRTLGNCSFFITFSAAETKWEPLLQALAKIVDNQVITEEEAKNLPYDKKCELIRSDPVTCMRYFDHRFRAFQNTILRPTPPRQGVFTPHDVIDHFSRVEFQKRGSPHVHGLYWMRNAPVYNEEDPSSEEAVIKFIDEFVTCERDQSEEMKELVGFQNHQHAQTCRRWFGTQRKCRFRYPQPPLPETMILKPLDTEITKEEKMAIDEVFRKISNDLEGKGRDFIEDIPFTQYLESLALTKDEYIHAIRSSINRTTVFLKRKTNAAFINAYNPTILKTWRANMDIQYVLDTYACAKYCVSYISKAEGGVSKLLQACLKDIQRGNHTMKEKLLRFASVLINGSEHSTQEAVAFLLGLPLTDCSRIDAYINTARPQDRIGMLRPEKEIEELGDENDDIYLHGVIDRYVNRPQGMENICLAEFASNYNFVKKRRKRVVEEDDSVEDAAESADSGEEESQDMSDSEGSFALEDKSGLYRKRKVRKIIRFRHYKKSSEEEEYWREQLMLFIPWRNEELELLDVDHLTKALENTEAIIENSKPFYHNRELDESDILGNIAEVEEDENNAPNEDQPLIDEEAEDYTRQYVSEQQSTSTMQRFLPPKFIPNDDYHRIMLALNVKQRKFVLHALHLLKTTNEPFYAFLHGGAGVGKSHTITAIVQCFLRYHQGFPSANPDCPPVIVTSFTGKAAFNIFGMTLSSAFRLQPLQNKKAQGKLDDGAANTLRSKLRDLKLLIVDEISMVGVRMLYDVEGRLRQIKCSNRPFGGVSVIVVGHLRQLKPIGDSWVFKDPTHLRAGELGTIWQLFTFFEFDEIMRQKDDVPFCKLLNNMSEGVMDADDIRLIKTREFPDCSAAPQNAIWLFQTNEECQTYNKRIHDSLQTEGCSSVANDTIEGARDKLSLKQKMLNFAKTLDVNQCEGLRYEVPLKVGAVYLISTNVDVSDGLFNGADGVLMQIDYGHNIHVPNRVWLKFKDPIIGSNKRAVSRNYQESRGIPLDWVPIERISKNLTKVKKEGAYLIRVQFPLLAANAMTIAKSQGSTLTTVVVGLNSNRIIGRESLYVACSRATSLNGLYIQGSFKPPSKPPSNDPVTLELQRLRELPLRFSIKFFQDYPDAAVKIYFHNIQSYTQFGTHAFADQCCQSADLISLVETRLSSKDVLNWESHQVTFRGGAKRTGNSFNSEGGLILAKPGAQFIDNLVYYGAGNSHLSTTICRIKDCILFTIYKHPNFPVARFLDTLAIILNEYDNFRCIVMGDLNVNASSEDGTKLIQLMNSLNLSSKLPLDAATTNFGTTIDYCFTNIETAEAWIYESYYSHHKPICFMF